MKLRHLKKFKLILPFFTSMWIAFLYLAAVYANNLVTLQQIHDKQVSRHENLLFQSGSTDVEEEYWFQNRIDHFDALNPDTYSQRFFKQMKYYKVDGPIFVYIGGEGPLRASSMRGHIEVSVMI